MNLSPVDQALLRIGTASNKVLKQVDEGFHWTSVTARTLTDLEHQVCFDRLQLAEHFLDAGNKLLRSRPPQYRSAISRFYYSMYHSARAVVFFENRGDDYQHHSSLPAKLPRSFSGSAVWQNNLKDARGRRNDADYDPYPLSSLAWKATTVTLQAHATTFLGLARQFLRQKGCAHV